LDMVCSAISPWQSMHIGRIYEGTIQERGTFINEDEKYVGDFERGFMHGYGTMTFAEGTYVGKFSWGGLSGPGTLTLNSGIKYTGIWNNDKIHGYGKIIYADGTEGQWKDDHPQFDPRHSMVKECVEKGLCTNTLKQKNASKDVLPSRT
jgi:hypothetical protein